MFARLKLMWKVLRGKAITHNLRIEGEADGIKISCGNDKVKITGNIITDGRNGIIIK